jgi:hypothetical protein
VTRTARFIRRQVYRKGYKGRGPEIEREGWQQLLDGLYASLGKRPRSAKRKLGLRKS